MKVNILILIFSITYFVVINYETYYCINQKINLPLYFYCSVKDTSVQNYIFSQINYIIADDESKLNEYLETNRFILSLNNSLYGTPGFFSIADIVPIITDTSAAVEMKFNYQDNAPSNNGYMVKWTSSRGTFVFAFPARPQILYDKDKTFFDSLFLAQLKNIAATPGTHKVKTGGENYDGLTPDTLTGFYYENGTNLLGFTDNRYFQKEEGRTAPVRSLANYRETIMNYIQQKNDLPANFLLDIEHRQYSGSVGVNGMPLADLINAMTEEEHKVLAGIDEGKDSMLTTVIFYNPYYGYIHMLYFTFPLESVINSRPITADAIIYAYIRLDNVKSYFEEYREKEKRFKVKTK